MDNWLKHQKEVQKADFENTKSSNIDIQKKNRHFKNNALSLRAKSRIESWVHDNELMKSMIEPLQKGSIPLMHTENYHHRSRNKELEKDSKGILVKSYMTAKDRGNWKETMNKERIMDRDDYNPNLPFKSQYLRERDPAGDINFPLRFGINPRLENTRIVEEIQKKSIIDHKARDMKMVHYPDWKEPHKEKWVGNQTLITKNCTYTGKRTFLPWSETPLFLDQREKYINGYETIGDLSRKRDKSKEFKKDEFISIIGPDIWNHTLKASNTWRTNRSDLIFRVKTDFDEFSKNEKKMDYKNTLIETKSVDHLVPFPHSNNLRGASLRDFRPNYQKIYNQSIKQYLVSEHTNNSTNLNNKQSSEMENQKREQRSSAKLSVKNQAIMEEKDSPLSTNSSTIRLLKKKKDLIFLNKEDKIKLAVTKCFGGLA